LELRRHAVCRLDRLSFIRHVDELRARPAAGGLDLGHGLVGRVEVDIGDDNVGAFAGEEHGAGSPDAGAGSRNKTDLALEPAHRYARPVPMSFASPSAIRMRAPSTASIQVELMSDRVRILVTSDSRITPVSAPIRRPRPPS